MYKYNYNKNWVNNNFDIKSYKISDLAVVRHIIENNTLSNAEAIDQNKLQFKNYIITGGADNLEEAERQIKLTNARAKGANKFPFKTIVETLNLQPQAPENQEIIKKWAEHEIESWKSKGLNIIISAVHLNETSVNLHIIVNNARKENDDLLFGWSLKSIKLDEDLQRQKDKHLKQLKEKNEKLAKEGKPLKRVRTDTFGIFETKQLHRVQEQALEKFCKENGLVYKQEATRISGKSLSIQEYKEIYKKIDSQAVQDSVALIDKLTKALETQTKLVNESKDKDIDEYLSEIKKRDDIIEQLTEIVQNTTQTKKRRSKNAKAK